MAEVAAYDNVVLPDSIGSAEAINYIARLRSAVSADWRVHTKQIGVRCEAIAAERFMAVKFLLPAEVIDNLPAELDFKYNGTNDIKYRLENGNRIFHQSDYLTYAYSARVLGRVSLEQSTKERPLDTLNDELLDSVLAQLLVESYSFGLLARAISSRAYTPVKNVGYISSRDAYTDILGNPGYEISYESNRYHGGHLVLSRKVGTDCR